jgi:Protein of unknown function (DUF2442)/Phage integrase, N-terminal SAM-like domain
MASSWIERRERGAGVRYRVRYRLGGRESIPRYAGTFATMREARARRDWVAGELAARRVPDTRFLDVHAVTPALRTVAERWQASRVDVAEGTAATHRVNLRRILPVLGDRTLENIESSEVAQLVAQLHDRGLKRESIRKTIATLAMILDYAGVAPNPARDKLMVKLPRETRFEPKPPTADHVLAAYQLLPRVYRLPLLVLDATGMRVGELEQLIWGDVDETRSRWRVSQAVSKTGRARWVSVSAMSTRTRTARITSVAPLDGFMLRLDFDDGTTREVDLEDELWGPVFEPLRNDSGLFRQVRVDAELGTIIWPNGADMDPDVLHGDHSPARRG